MVNEGEEMTTLVIKEDTFKVAVEITKVEISEVEVEIIRTNHAATFVAAVAVAAEDVAATKINNGTTLSLK